MKVSGRPRLKLRAVAAGTMAPELVCWPMSSKKTCKREPLIVNLKLQACPADLLGFCPVSSDAKDCRQNAVIMVKSAELAPASLAEPATASGNFARPVTEYLGLAALNCHTAQAKEPGRLADSKGLCKHAAHPSQDRSYESTHLGVGSA